MFSILSGVAAVFATKEIITEKSRKTISADDWGNMKLYQQDVLSGVSHEQRMKNLSNGKYRINK